MMILEQWRTCVYDGEVFEQYEVSKDGRVRSLNYRGHGKVQELKQSKNKSGYLSVILNKNGKTKLCYIHRLVAFTWIPNDDTEHKTEVNHLDHNRQNNHVENLQWCTHQYNIEYSHAKRVLCIETGKVYDSVRQVERETGLAESSISNCCNGHKKYSTCGGYHWKYVD